MCVCPSTIPAFYDIPYTTRAPIPMQNGYWSYDLQNKVRLDVSQGEGISCSRHGLLIALSTRQIAIKLFHPSKLPFFENRTNAPESHREAKCQEGVADNRASGGSSTMVGGQSLANNVSVHSTPGFSQRPANTVTAQLKMRL